MRPKPDWDLYPIVILTNGDPLLRLQIWQPVVPNELDSHRGVTSLSHEDGRGDRCMQGKYRRVVSTAAWSMQDHLSSNLESFGIGYGRPTLGVDLATV